jgi:hypothetical protein
MKTILCYVFTISDLNKYNDSIKLKTIWAKILNHKTHIPQHFILFQLAVKFCDICKNNSAGLFKRAMQENENVIKKTVQWMAMFLNVMNFQWNMYSTNNGVKKIRILHDIQYKTPALYIKSITSAWRTPHITKLKNQYLIHLTGWRNSNFLSRNSTSNSVLFFFQYI